MTIQDCLTKLSEDTRLQGLAVRTRTEYARIVRKFFEFHQAASADELTEEHVRSYILACIDQGWKKSSVNCAHSALRFFFAYTLNRPLNYFRVPRMKEDRSLPETLSHEEVLSILEAADNPKYRAIFSLAYGSGLRISEVCALRISDIQSDRNRVRVRSGKGGKDRYTTLSRQTLRDLRIYWKAVFGKSSWHPEDFLFPGARPGTHLTAGAVEAALHKYVKRTQITRHVTMHTLRHSFASNLLEKGVNIFQIKELLGHSSIASTCVYLHLTCPFSDAAGHLDLFS